MTNYLTSCFLRALNTGSLFFFQISNIAVYSIFNFYNPINQPTNQQKNLKQGLRGLIALFPTWLWLLAFVILGFVLYRVRSWT